MKIRTQLLVALVVFGLTMSIVAALVIFTSARSSALDAQSAATLTIERGVTDLGYLSDDYLLHREPAQRVRWESKWSSIAASLSRLRPEDADQQAIVGDIRRNMRSLHSVFTEVADAIESRRPVTPLSDAFIQVSWSRIAVQDQGIAFDVSRLAEALREENGRLTRLREQLTLALMVLLGTYAITNLTIVFRRVLATVAELRAGAKVIGSGDLEHTIPVKRHDEIGELARAFNRMAAELKETTASKTELEREIAERLAAESALAETATENARLYQEQKLGVVYAETINRINDTIHSTLDLGPKVDSVLKDASDVLGLEASAIHMRDGDAWSLAYSCGISTDGIPPDHDEPLLAPMIVASDGPVVVENVRTDERMRGDAMRGLGVHAFIAVPLTSRGQVTGALCFASLAGPVAFSPRQIDFVVKVAGTLSLAIENVRLYANAYRVAETLQGALLDLPGAIPGMDFAHAYRSATEATRVGGDFYDLFEIDDRLLGITVGDISGKGIEAAVLTSLVKYTIRAHAADGKSPADALRLTNRVVFRGSLPEAFSTVFFAILDRGTGRLSYCNAGHTPVAIVGSDGAVAGLPATSPILGAFPDAGFVDSVADLGAADMLVAYTDGVTEARSGRTWFGEERLFELLSELACEATDRTVDRMLERVMSFTGNRLTDDVAILALRLSEGAPA